MMSGYFKSYATLRIAIQYMAYGYSVAFDLF